MDSRLQNLCVLVASASVGGTAVASGFDSDLAKATQTINASYEYGLPVDKSNTVDGTDFGADHRFGLSVYTGTTKALGLGIRSEQSATDFSQADGSTRGGGLGVRIPAGSATVQFEALYVVVPKAIDAAGHAVKIGPRTDIDLGVALQAFTEHLAVTTGYRYRTYAIAIDGASASELETGPYLGFRVGISP